SDLTADDQGESLWRILTAGGWIGYLIIVLSVAAAALVIEHLMTIRATVLMPPGLAEQTRELVKNRQFVEAERQCKERPSFLSFVLHAGLTEIEGGWSAVEK